MNISRRLGAELFGTFWLVLGGCVIMGATQEDCSGFCTDYDRPGANLDLPYQHSRYKHFCKFRAQHRSSTVRAWLALGQLWLFWLAPLVGGAIGSILHRSLTAEADVTVALTAAPAHM